LVTDIDGLSPPPAVVVVKWRYRPLSEFIVAPNAINVINGRYRRISPGDGRLYLESLAKRSLCPTSLNRDIINALDFGGSYIIPDKQGLAGVVAVFCGCATGAMKPLSLLKSYPYRERLPFALPIV
jgi:hypothetical protein